MCMECTLNIAVVGSRGSGKTTLCHRLVGLEPPCIPYETGTLDYLQCSWNACNVLIWDHPPGVSEHTSNLLRDMDCIVLCVDGRQFTSTYNALDMLLTQYNNVVIALTRSTCVLFGLPFRVLWLPITLKSAPVFQCGYSVDALQAHLFDRCLQSTKSSSVCSLFLDAVNCCKHSN